MITEWQHSVRSWRRIYYPDNYVHSSSAYWPNDIAIIKLENDLNVSNFVGVLNSTVNDNYPTGGSYKAVGHGYVSTNTTGEHNYSKRI
ncbi:Secreted trypsin-like serine protease [Vibrio mimicus]|nr:Secreted trypsin-like serine protease [Vibrio mimicus]